MTPERLKEIADRVAEASPGPWYWCLIDLVNDLWKFVQATDIDEEKRLCRHAPGSSIGRQENWKDVLYAGSSYDGEQRLEVESQADMEFIAHSRQDIPDLLALVAELEAALSGRTASCVCGGDTAKAVKLAKAEAFEEASLSVGCECTSAAPVQCSLCSASDWLKGKAATLRNEAKENLK